MGDKYDSKKKYHIPYWDKVLDEVWFHTLSKKTFFKTNLRSAIEIGKSSGGKIPQIKSYKQFYWNRVGRTRNYKTILISQKLSIRKKSYK